jgi:hypothetical protein
LLWNLFSGFIFLVFLLSAHSSITFFPFIVCFQSTFRLDICGQFASIGHQPNNGGDVDYSPVMPKRQSILKTSDSFKNSTVKKATAFSLENVDETKGHRKSGNTMVLCVGFWWAGWN